MSDKSDDEEMIFKRFQRFYRHDQGQAHNNKPFLQSRKIEQFEILLIEAMGGREIIQDVFKKDLPRNPDIVYQWIDPGVLDQPAARFLDQDMDGEFDELYSEEVEM